MARVRLRAVQRQSVARPAVRNVPRPGQVGEGGEGEQGEQGGKDCRKRGRCSSTSLSSHPVHTCSHGSCSSPNVTSVTACVAVVVGSSPADGGSDLLVVEGDPRAVDHGGLTSTVRFLREMDGRVERGLPAQEGKKG